MLAGAEQRRSQGMSRIRAETRIVDLRNRGVRCQQSANRDAFSLWRSIRSGSV